MEINNKQINPVQYRSTADNSAGSEKATDELKQHMAERNTAERIIPSPPVNYGDKALSLQHDVPAKISAETKKEIANRMERFSQYVNKDTEQTKTALSTSFSEFERFKNIQSSKSPDLDLTGLDLTLQDGDLKLTSNKLTAEQLSLLETEVAKNSNLHQAMTSLFENMADMTNYVKQTFSSHQTDNYDEISAENLEGRVGLNQLVNNVDAEFDRANYAEEYYKDSTFEQRLEIINTFELTESILDTVPSRINIQV